MSWDSKLDFTEKNGVICWLYNDNGNKKIGLGLVVGKKYGSYVVKYAEGTYYDYVKPVTCNEIKIKAIK